MKKLAHWFRCLLTKISPSLNTRVVYFVKFGKFLNLNNPVTLNEKILWLKLNKYLNSSLVKDCADKFRVRKYVENKGASECLVEVIGQYSKPEEIEWSQLPEKFVIKLNVGCGFNYIVLDKAKEDEENVKNKIKDWIKKAPRYYLGYSEMQYKDVEIVIMVEKFLNDGNGGLPDDYKFYCFNGVVKLIMPCIGRDLRGKGANYLFFDENWHMIASRRPVGEDTIPKPRLLEKAINIAENLSKPFPFVRVDLYIFENAVYFGELTFTPAAGMDVDHLLHVQNSSKDIDHVYGKLLKL